jgi:hypothetical protein
VVRITGAPGRQQSAVEDDFHSFVVAIRHDGVSILGVEAESLRTPWATCPMAAEALQALVGLPLAGGLRMASETRTLACTHMLDQAALAIAHAPHGTPRLEYRMEVEAGPDRTVRAELARDGEPLFAWRVVKGVIEGGELDGVPVATITRHAAGRLSAADMEAAVALRRAIHVSGARRIDMDAIPNAGALVSTLAPTCYSLRHEIRSRALRNKGSARDWSGQGRWPLAEEA